MRYLTLSSMVVLALALAVPAGATAPDDTLYVNEHRLTLSGHGTRNALVFVELYAVALYLPRKLSTPEAIEQPDLPKAVRVEIRYDGSIPDRIPSRWREELMPLLTAEQRRTLIRHYERLEQGDTLTIAYAPETGTSVALNGQRIIQADGPEVMNAFLTLWIGPQPVSAELKEALL